MPWTRMPSKAIVHEFRPGPVQQGFRRVQRPLRGGRQALHHDSQHLCEFPAHRASQGRLVSDVPQQHGQNLHQPDESPAAGPWFRTASSGTPWRSSRGSQTRST
jgi:hypothetical protein